MDGKYNIYILGIIEIIILLVSMIMMVSAQVLMPVAQSLDQTETDSIEVPYDNFPEPSITSHEFHVYGSKQYFLPIMQYYYNFGFVSVILTSKTVPLTINDVCYNDENSMKGYIEVSSSLNGSSEGTIPRISNSVQTYGGANFENLKATCFSNAQIINGQQNIRGVIFNANALSYPSIRSGMIYKNSLTDEYYVLFDADNYDGGICKISYTVDSLESNQHIRWEKNLDNCPNHVTYLAPLQFNSTLIVGEQIWLNIILKPTTDNALNMYTQGFGGYYFNKETQKVILQDKDLIPFTAKILTETEKIQTIQKTNERLQQEVAAHEHVEAIN